MKSPALLSQEQSPAMPPRGERQGFKIGRNGRRYWIASQANRAGTMGFPDRCIELPTDVATDEAVSEFCREQNARLNAWIEDQKARQSHPTDTLTRYDGTVRSACRIFQEHKLSPFNLRMKFNTQRTYLSFLGLIEATAGHHLVRNVTVPLVQSWYEDWLAPDFEGDRQHRKRASEGVQTFRAVVYFLASLRRYDGCAQLATELKLVQFEKPQARTQAITLGQVQDFLRAAETQVRLGKMAAERALAMAIGVAAQFELMVRQKDIIGEWAKFGTKRTLPIGISTVEHGGDVWAGFFTWESIHGWRWVMRTSKSRYREPGDFRLQSFGLLFPLLDQVPHEERVGAIVKGEHGLPVRYRSYVRWFRQIARAAGIPDDLWNMDSRAGGATEADMAGARLEDIQGALTHKGPAMTRRYIRSGPAGKIEAVAEARARSRKQGGGGQNET